MTAGRRRFRRRSCLIPASLARVEKGKPVIRSFVPIRKIILLTLLKMGYTEEGLSLIAGLLRAEKICFASILSLYSSFIDLFSREK